MMLMIGVVQNWCFWVMGIWCKLLLMGIVVDGDGQCFFGGVQFCLWYIYVVVNQSVEYSKEVLGRILNVIVVGIFFGNVIKVVEQVFVGYLYLIKLDVFVVYIIEVKFVVIVFYLNIGVEFVFGIVKWYYYCVYIVIFVINNELGKNVGYFIMKGIVNVFFAGFFVWGVDD